MSIVERFRSWRIQWKLRRSLRRSKDAPLREFVYMDETSVYSLLSSKVGPVLAELTESQSSSLKNEVSTELSLDTKLVKAKAGDKLEGSRTVGTQAVRRAAIQATFKQLYDDVRPTFSLRLPDVDVDAPKATTLSDVASLASGDSNPWALSANKLRRGQLIEITVELEAADVFKANSVISTISNMVRDSPEMFGIGADQLQQAVAISALLNQFMVGLVPLYCRAVDYKVLLISDEPIVLHSAVVAQLPQSQQGLAKPLVIAGVAESGLFWRDVRRLLFTPAKFQLMCRLNDSRLLDDWSPVKLMDVLGGKFGHMRDVIFAMTENVLGKLDEPSPGLVAPGGTSPAVDAIEHYMKALEGEFALTLEPDLRSAVGEIASNFTGSLDDVEARRKLFAEVTGRFRERCGVVVSPEKAIELRQAAIASADLERRAGSQSVRSVAAQRRSEHILDVEVIAIYW